MTSERKVGLLGFAMAFAVITGAEARALVRPADASTSAVVDSALAFSTYLGGSGDEADWLYGSEVAIAVDAAGNSYVTGTTTSPDFPTTPGNDRTLHGNQDAFVTKISPNGDVLYSTFLGGVCDDIARGIAVDAAGNAYITGRANAGFCPVGVEPGVLVAKLGPTGALVYSLVFGGSFADTSIGQGIAVDAGGNAYVTGLTQASPREFPTTPGAFRTQACNDVWDSADGFVAKVDAAGAGLLYSTYLCGTGHDSPNGIRIDATGAAYVAGSTNSPDFPTVNALQPEFPSGSDGVSGFVTKLSPDGGHLVYSTYLGGSTGDVIGGIALDALGNVYVTGETASEDFPTTPGVVQERPGARLCVPIGPCTDAFVTKLDPSGAAIVWSTYLYGELDDGGSGIAVDGAGNVYVVGTTNSWFFPVLRALQPIVGGTSDAFVAKLSADGTHLVYSSPLGGSTTNLGLLKGWDGGSSIAVDAAGNAYVAGSTQSDDFPTTPGAFQPGLGGGGCDVIGLACRDAFVTKISPNGPGVVPSIRLSATPSDTVPGATVTATWAGHATPTASDRIELWVLGGEGVLVEAVTSWATGAVGNGTLALALPAELPTGTYELRLMTPDPDYFYQLGAIARSEPIRVAAPTPTTTTQPTTTTTTTRPTTTTTTRPTTTTTTMRPTTTTISTTSSTTRPTTTSSTSSTTHAPTTTTLHATTSTTTSTTARPTTTTPPTTPTTTVVRPTTTSSTTTSSTAHPSTSSTTTSELPTTTTIPTTPCDTGGISVCDDGDPCTVDACSPGVGCQSAPTSGFASVTCTCLRGDPAACADDPLPSSIAVRRARVCDLFDGAAAATDPTLARRRLRRGIRNLKDAISNLSRARRTALSDGCARALDAELRDAKSRAERLLSARSEGSRTSTID